MVRWSRRRGPLQDVDVVTDAVEPFQHNRAVLAGLSHLLDRNLNERDRLTHRLAQDPGRFGHGLRVAGDVDGLAVSLSCCSNAMRPYLPMSASLIGLAPA